MEFKNQFFYTFVIWSVILSFCIDSVITKIAYKQMKNDFPLDIETTESCSNMSSEDNDLEMTTPYRKNNFLASANKASFKASKDIATAANIKTTSNSPSGTSCICGIFLSSQFVKGSSESPKGDPVISTTLERSFVCNSVGQKLCQTRCLQQIVQHLHNSAKILCASLDRDIRKEKAFLFVSNCNEKWYNTNLAAGKEYCCKNGLPYNCPKK